MGKKFKMTKEMGKEIISDLRTFGGYIQHDSYELTRVVAMPVIGNLPEHIKREIYKETLNESMPVSRIASAVSMIGNIALAYAYTCFSGEDKSTLDYLVMGYTMADSFFRMSGMLNPPDHHRNIWGDYRKYGTAPGSFVGGIVGWPLWGLKEYLKNTYTNATLKQKEKPR